MSLVFLVGVGAAVVQEPHAVRVGRPRALGKVGPRLGRGCVAGLGLGGWWVWGETCLCFAVGGYLVVVMAVITFGSLELT